MAGRIERLTPSQIAAMADIRDEWLAVGLATGPADRARAEQAVRVAYAAAGLPAPTIHVWLRSPMEGVVGAAMLRHLPRAASRSRKVWGQVWGQVGDQVGGQVWGQIRDQVGDQIRDQVWGQVRDQVGDQVWGQVWGQVGDQIRDQVWGQVGDQVGDQVWGQVWGQVGDQVGDQVWGQVWGQVGEAVYGQHEAGWLAFYDYFGRACGLESPQRLQGIMDVARSSGWWWPFQGAVVLTERPIRLERDQQHRLHSATGPAIQHPDGWGVWAWHGVRVPSRVIEAPETLTPAAVFTERNVEVRRVMIERLGADRLLAMTPRAHVRHTDSDQLGHRRRLLELAFDDDEPIVMVEVVNSTPEPDQTFRQYMLRVPPATRTCAEAVAWTFGVEAGEYAPASET